MIIDENLDFDLNLVNPKLIALRSNVNYIKSIHDIKSSDIEELIKKEIKNYSDNVKLEQNKTNAIKEFELSTIESLNRIVKVKKNIDTTGKDAFLYSLGKFIELLTILKKQQQKIKSVLMNDDEIEQILKMSVKMLAERLHGNEVKARTKVNINIFLSIVFQIVDEQKNWNILCIYSDIENEKQDEIGIVNLG